MGSPSMYGAIWGLLIGDAIAMPVHWYYNPMYIKRDYGSWLTGYVAPKEKHPTSIMNLSSTVGSGRSSGNSKGEKEIIGSIILHNKREYWGRRNGIHYHHGMKAGENTLNATLAVEIFKTLQSIDPDVNVDPIEVRGSVMENYIRFMTTPNTHNDTYAESCHRMFFRDWVQEDNPPKDGPSIIKFCEERFRKVKPGLEDSQIPCIGAFVLVLPWIVHYADKNEDTCAQCAVEAIKLTHPAPSVLDFVELYARLVHAVLNGSDLRAKVLEIAESPVLGHPNKRKVIEKFSEEASRNNLLKGLKA